MTLFSMGNRPIIPVVGKFSVGFDIYISTRGFVSHFLHET